MTGRPVFIRHRVNRAGDLTGVDPAHGVERWLFLGTADPTLVEWTHSRGEGRFAVRLSRFDPAAWTRVFP